MYKVYTCDNKKIDVLVKNGLNVFCPSFYCYGFDIENEGIKQYCDWLEACDAVLLPGNYEDRADYKSINIEIQHANLHGIPVFKADEFDKMLEYLNVMKTATDFSLGGAKN